MPNPRTLVVTISQSGETADTLAALDEAKQKGATTLGIVNVVGSSIARATDAGVYLRVGPEIGVASTKAFTTQLAALFLFAVRLGRLRGTLTAAQGREQLEAGEERGPDPGEDGGLGHVRALCASLLARQG